MKKTIRGVERWKGEVHLKGDVIIHGGGTLIIEPGAVIERKRYQKIVVNGALIAKGTPHQKIHFKQASSLNKSWKNGKPFIHVGSNNAKVVIEHACF